MSELRDLAAALRAFDKRLTSVEDCLLVLVRNSEQQAEWRHAQRNAAQVERGEREARQRSLAQLQEFQGALWNYLGKLDEKLEALSKTRHDDVTELKRRMHSIEEKVGGEEITQP